MPDGTTQIATSIYDITKWVIVFLLGFVGYNAKKTVNRVDKLEENLMPRDEITKLLNRMRDENREDFQRLYDRLDK